MQFRNPKEGSSLVKGVLKGTLIVWGWLQVREFGFTGLAILVITALEMIHNSSGSNMTEKDNSNSNCCQYKSQDYLTCRRVLNVAAGSPKP